MVETHKQDERTKKAFSGREGPTRHWGGHFAKAALLRQTRDQNEAEFSFAPQVERDPPQLGQVVGTQRSAPWPSPPAGLGKAANRAASTEQATSHGRQPLGLSAGGTSMRARSEGKQGKGWGGGRKNKGRGTGVVHGVQRPPLSGLLSLKKTSIRSTFPELRSDGPPYLLPAPPSTSPWPPRGTGPPTEWGRPRRFCRSRPCRIPRPQPRHLHQQARERASGPAAPGRGPGRCAGLAGRRCRCCRGSRRSWRLGCRGGGQGGGGGDRRSSLTGAIVGAVRGGGGRGLGLEEGKGCHRNEEKMEEVQAGNAPGGKCHHREKVGPFSPRGP